MYFKKISALITAAALLSGVSVSAYAENTAEIFSDAALYDAADDNSVSVQNAAAEPVVFSEDETTGSDTNQKIDWSAVTVKTIEINSADDLRAFRDAVNGTGETSLAAQAATVNLNCDIDLGGEEWVPIGYPAASSSDDAAPSETVEEPGYSSDRDSFFPNSFIGTFNGNGHTIKNFKFTNPELKAAGLFYSVFPGRKLNKPEYAGDIAISNLTVSDVTVNLENTEKAFYVGAVVGISTSDAYYKDISVENYSVNITKIVTGDRTDGHSDWVCCGGVIGYGARQIDNLSASGDININAACAVYAGGVMGMENTINTKPTDGFIFKNCTSSVNIDITGKSQVFAGGVFGYIHPDGAVENCHYTGKKISSHGTTGCTYVGGIAGYSFTSFADCTVGDAELFSDGDYITGIAGITPILYKDIQRCSATANLTANADYKTVSACYVGGIVALAPFESKSTDPLTYYKCVIEDCIYTGKTISVTSYNGILAGGIIGKLMGDFAVKNCYAEFDSFTVKLTGPAVKTNTGFAGGVAGGIYSGNVLNSVAKGNITVNSNYTVYCGGVSGYETDLPFYYYTLDSNNNTITVESVTPSVISNSYSDCDIKVSGNSVYAGGICGQIFSQHITQPTQSMILNSCSYGDVTVTTRATSLVGGGVGYTIDSYIADCASYGDLTINPTTALLYGGGFISRLKENNKNWTDAKNPLCQTYRCYTTGNVYNYASSSSVHTGYFTYESSSDANKLYPKYSDCYYTANAPIDGALGGCITDVSDKANYKNFDFEKTWSMYSGKAVPNSAAPAICSADKEYENNVAVKINSVTVAQPDKVKAVALVLTDVVTKDKTLKTFPIGEVGESEKYFKTVNINYAWDAFETADIFALPNDTAVYSETLKDGKLNALVLNNSGTDTIITVYSAEYNADGTFKAFVPQDITVGADSAEQISADIPDTASKVLLWNGMTPLCSAIKR